jgi:hypothetical protein
MSGMCGELALYPGDHSKEILMDYILFLGVFPFLDIVFFGLGLFLVIKSKGRLKKFGPNE